MSGLPVSTRLFAVRGNGKMAAVSAVLLALLAVFVTGATAQNTAVGGSLYLPVVIGPSQGHFDDCAFLTGNNATIAVPGDVVINGAFKLAKGDEIAIFNEASTLCAGMKSWSGRNIALTAWGDDPLTPAVDGLLEGEEMRYRIWDQSEKQEINVAAAAYEMGDGLYRTNGIYIVASLRVE